MTNQEIIDDLMENLSEDDADVLRNTKKDDLIMFHHSFGRYIRNEYGLWDHPWEPELVDGIDVSPNHPDAISKAIIEQLHERLTSA